MKDFAIFTLSAMLLASGACNLYQIELVKRVQSAKAPTIVQFKDEAAMQQAIDEAARNVEAKIHGR